MKILVLGSDIPATSNMPGSPRLFNLCRYLSQRHSLTLAILDQTEERYREFCADPVTAGVFSDIIVLPPAPGFGWIGSQIHRLRQAPYFVTRYRTPAFYAEQSGRIRDMYLRGAFDAIFVDLLSVAQYVEGADLRCPAVVDLHDCFTLLSTRTRQRERSWLTRLRLYFSVRTIAKMEAGLSRTFGAIIVNSSVDHEFLRQLNPAANTLTIGNGVDSDFFSPGDDAPDMGKIVFTGVMTYAPNEDAAVHFAETVLPLIQKRHPAVEFWIVGKSPSPRVQALAERRGVHVTGGVPDVRPYARSAGVIVSPLRFGTGIKNKLLAALSMRKPVVATSATIEGLGVVNGRDLLVADDPVEFAEKVMQLIEDPAYGKRLAESGYAFVRERYSWQSSARQLEEALIDAVDRAGNGQPR